VADGAFGKQRARARFQWTSDRMIELRNLIDQGRNYRSIADFFGTTPQSARKARERLQRIDAHG